MAEHALPIEPELQLRSLQMTSAQYLRSNVVSRSRLEFSEGWGTIGIVVPLPTGRQK